jgi:hypothetical protein
MLTVATPDLLAAFLRLDRILGRLDAELWRAVQEVGRAREATAAIVAELRGLSIRDVTCRDEGLPDLKLLIAEADAGALSLDIDRHADWSAEVSVNGREAFHLRPQLAALLTVIAAAAAANDGREGWRTKMELASALGRQIGREVKPDNMTKMVHRLRRAFRRARENWRLIQVRVPTSEYRFALRRDCA